MSGEFFLLFAKNSAKAAAKAAEAAGDGGGNSNSLSWALVLLCAVLGMIVTLTPTRRTTEVKRQKAE